MNRLRKNDRRRNARERQRKAKDAGSTGPPSVPWRTAPTLPHRMTEPGLLFSIFDFDGEGSIAV
jgi:hypothetical protein